MQRSLVLEKIPARLFMQAFFSSKFFLCVGINTRTNIRKLDQGFTLFDACHACVILIVYYLFIYCTCN